MVSTKPKRLAKGAKAAIAKAKELGYSGLDDLESRGTEEHKAAARAAFESQK